MTTKRGTQILLTLSLLLAAALPVSARASDSIQLPIDTPAEAHAAVIANGTPFGDFVLLDDALIGASQYYEVKGGAWKPCSLDRYLHVRMGRLPGRLHQPPHVRLSGGPSEWRGLIR